MLHGKTPRDIIAVLADIGNIVWSNNDFRVYDVTNLDDWNSINWTESSEFEIEVVVKDT